MRKPIFYFICVFFISLALYPLFQEGNSEISDKVLISAILILGIPHGAIDNILMKRRTGMNSIRFYVFYLSLIAINALLWFIYPALSLFFFLLISAYHFGQAQLSQEFNSKNWVKHLGYILWGNTVLTAFFLFNGPEIQGYFSQFPKAESISFLFEKDALTPFFIGNLIGTLGFLFWGSFKKYLNMQVLLIEILILGMVLAISYLFHFVFGFAIFFVLLHAIPVLMQEYSELYSSQSLKTILSFLKLLSPFSIISLVGIFGLFYLKEQNIIDLSYLFLILIATSSITLPHVWVMKKFYRE